MADTEQTIRKPAVAGTFYPADRERLRSEIKNYLEKVEQDRTGEDIAALVAPHAGYMYSGPVAAVAYRQVQGKDYDTVVVISPSHREYFEFSSVFSGSAYETPLGRVEIDTGLSRELAESSGGTVRISGSGHLHSSEHALEVHLPFLQEVLGRFKLVAIVMGRQDLEACRDLGDSLARALRGGKSLIVASSDLSHFHNQKAAEGLDSRVVEKINLFDPEGLLADVAGHNCEACGAGSVAAAMFAARKLGATKAENLHYATSGEISGDFNQVVGYTASIFYR
ncbi:MAG: AmmeMemoRadiSam system protein B [Candidatus Glassbacteria bacterium]|nr:AmmeMemoRadiSam system protein B [Candidatus Glassbacteria bacterium]